MNTNAKTLRTLVMDNALELGRLTREQVGKEDYEELTTLYRNALDALTEWASKDENHTSTQEDSDNAFNTCKAVLELYATDEDRIIIDLASMRSIRDRATKTKRGYSDTFKKANKALNDAKKTLKDREEDLAELGIALPEEDCEDLNAWANAITVNKVLDGIDRVELYVAAVATLSTRSKKVADIKKAGKWTWLEVAPQADNTFADLFENYIANCLIDGRNMKTSKAIRDEKAEARKAKATK